MKNFLVILAVALSATSAGTVAHAATANAAFPELTRAQVGAELAAARAAGTIQQGDETLVLPSVSTRSRSEVRADLAAAVVAGTVQRGDATYIPVAVSTLSRTEVEADLFAWNNAHLADEWRGQQTPNIYSSTYRIKQVTYERTLASQSTSRVASVQ